MCYAATQHKGLKLTFLIPSTRPPNSTLSYCHDVFLLHKVDDIKEDIEKATDIPHSIVIRLSLKTDRK